MFAKVAAHHRDGLWAKLMPELASACALLLLCLGIGVQWFGPALQDTLALSVAAEFSTWMLMCTLIDVATRLRKPPPAWLGLLIVGGLFVLYPEAFTMLALAWQAGAWVFLPIAWSVVERLRELWTLPNAPLLEKQRRRALTFGRLYTGLAFAGTFTIVMLVGAVLDEDQQFPSGLVDALLPWFVLVFYLVAAFDAWRVHRPAFAKRPRSLWPFMDRDDIAKLDPL